MTDELLIDQDEFQGSTEGTDPQAFPTLAFDADKYRQSLPEGEIPEAQAQDYLEVLFHIMHTVIDMGMDLNPAHSLIGDACEKTGADSEKSVQRMVSPSFNQAGILDTKHEKEKEHE